MPEDPIIPIISFDTTEVTFDNDGFSWDTCGYKQKIAILSDALDISGGLAMVVEHGDNNKTCSRLDIFDDISLSVKLTNPMFNNIGSHSLPFNIPASSHNLKVFGFPNRIERYTEFKHHQYPMYIFSEGLNILTGVLVITSAEPSSIECYFKSGNGDFWSSVKDKNLKDINLGESDEFPSEVAAIDYLSDSARNKYPYYPFTVFPVVNLGLAKDLSFADASAGLNGSWRGITMVNYWEVDQNDPNYGRLWSPWTSITPFLYLPFVLDKLFKNQGFVCTDNFILNSAELSSLVLYSNVSKFWSDNPNLSFTIPGPRPNKIIYNEYLPEYPIADFIENLGKLFCSWLFVNDCKKHLSFKLFKDIIKSSDVIPINKITSDIKITIGEKYDSFLFEFTNDNKLYHENDIREFTDSPRTIPPAVVSLPLPTQLSEGAINNLCFVYENDFYYNVVDSQIITLPIWWVSEWKQFSRDIQKKYGSSLENCLKISSELFTLPQHYGAEPNPTGFYYRACFPFAHHRNFFELKPIDDIAEADHTPKLLFYRGIQPDESLPSNQYPLGTFDVYKANKASGNPLTMPGASITLQWGGQFGLVNNFYKEYLQWKMAGPDKLEFEAWLNVTEIASIDFSRKYSINNSHLFLDNVEFGITSKGVTATKITAYKI